MKDIYEGSIILIGPSGAGKSTVAKMFEERGMPRICLDGWANRARKDGRRKMIEDIAIRDGKNPHDEFNLALIQTVVALQEEKDIVGVCDFGAGHAIFETENGLKKCKQILSKYKNIVLLLPCRDREEAIKIMQNRSTGDFSPNEDFLKSGCYEKLATMIIYADAKSPQEIADEITSKIEKRKIDKTIEVSQS